MKLELFERILVPVDGSKQSMEAVDFALQQAALSDGGVEALHVIDEQLIGDLGRFQERKITDVERELREDGKNYLRAVRRLAEGRGVACNTELRSGVPHREILAEADIKRVSCILMARVGKRGPGRTRIGQVTERVIESAKCPVIVMPEVN